MPNEPYQNLLTTLEVPPKFAFMPGITLEVAMGAPGITGLEVPIGDSGAGE